MKAIVPLEPRAYQVAEECQLGVPREEYRDENEATWLTVLGLLICGILFLFACWTITQIRSALPNSSDWSELMRSFTSIFVIIACVIVGGLFLVVGLLGIVHRTKLSLRGEPRFYVCEEGLVIADRKSVKAVVRLNDVDSIQQRIVAPSTDKGTRPGEQNMVPKSFYTFLLKSGKRHTFPQEISGALVHDVLEARWPIMLEQYQAGQAVAFGYVSVYVEGLRLNIDDDEAKPEEASPHSGDNWLLRLIISRLDRKAVPSGTAIETGEHFLPWNEVETPWIDKSRSTLIISRKGSERHWAVLPLHRVTNVDLCLKLIDHIQQETVQVEEEWR